MSDANAGELSDPDDAGRPLARSGFQLARDRTYGPFFAGRITSAVGIWIQNITAALVMWELTGSTLLVGAISSAQFMGPLVLSTWVGALTDRWDRRLMLLGGRLVSFVTAGTLAVASLLPSVQITSGGLLTAATLLGLGLAISSPAMQALVPDLVPSHDLDQAVAMNALVGSIARAVGPAIGAYLVLAGGPTLGFGIASLGHGFFAFALTRIHVASRVRNSEQRVLDGWRYVFRVPAVLSILIGVTALGFGVDTVVTLTPALSNLLGRGESAVGLIGSSFGVGAIIGAALVRRMRLHASLRLVGLIGFLVMGLGMTLAGSVLLLSAAVFGYGLAGCGFLLATTSANTRIQRHVPGDLRGRVMALWSVAFLGSRPIAAAVNGWVADAYSVQAALIVSGAIAFCAIPLASPRLTE